MFQRVRIRARPKSNRRSSTNSKTVTERIVANRNVPPFQHTWQGVLNTVEATVLNCSSDDMDTEINASPVRLEVASASFLSLFFGYFWRLEMNLQ